MNEASAVESPVAPTATEAPWDPPDRRRTLQLALAALWFLDAVLQLQPFMFSRSFGPLMLGPTARGNPGIVAHSITDVSRSIGQHSVGANAAFVLVQFLIAFAIAHRPTVCLGLVLSVAWSLLVWWFGEGLGGVLAGTASPLTGAPGAVLLYAVLAVLLWPTARRPAAPCTAARLVGPPVAKVLWVAIWGWLAGIAFFGSPTRHPGTLLAGLEAGEPGWLAALNRHAADLVASRGPLLAVVVGLLFVVIAVAVFLPTRPARVVLAVAMVVGLAIWVVGEDFGTVFSGSGTDPNSGPLLGLLAVAYWPLRRAGSRRWVEAAA